MRARRAPGFALACAVLASAAGAPAAAQSILDSEARLAPQFVQFRVNAPAEETISQLSVPLFLSIPFGSRLVVDVGTAYANARLTSATTTSEISGLVDTQVRGNLTLGSDFVILTAGLNLPTGNSGVTLEQLTAAGRIGNPFLGFPVSNMGAGLAGTGGIAIARPLGSWNVGFGGAVRRSASYAPFDVPGETLTFQPGNEYRARLGVDRTVGGGRAAFAITYSAFSLDEVGGARYSTGNRIIGQTVYSNNIGGADLTVAAYDVYRLPGFYGSGEPAGRENIANVFASVSTDRLGPYLEPSVELRHWAQAIAGALSGEGRGPSRTQSSYLGTIGLRTRVTLIGLVIVPSGGYTLGSLATSDSTGAPATAGVTGFKAQVAVRVGR